MAEDAEASIEALRAPLCFAAKNEFKNLPVLRDLERTLLGLLDRVRNQSGLTKALGSLVDEVQSLVAGLDGLEEMERRRRVSRMLERIENFLHPSTQSAVPASPPAVRPSRKLPKSPSSSVGSRAQRIQPRFASLTTPLQLVVGIGPKTAEKLASRSLLTVQDALLFLPRRYEDEVQGGALSEASVGERLSLSVRSLGGGQRFAGRGRRFFELRAEASGSILVCRFFQFRLSALERFAVPGTDFQVSGKLQLFGRTFQMVHPELSEIKTPIESTGTSVSRRPVYLDVAGLGRKTLEKILQTLARECAHLLDDPMPPKLVEAHGLKPLADSVREAHLPPQGGQPLEATRQRLAFDELFFLELGLRLARRKRARSQGIAHPVVDWLALSERMFPFSLTEGQKKVLGEIQQDLAQAQPMHRLLQGDVGAGKTAVALLASAIVAQGGEQVVLLAPTEVLAVQQYHSAQKALGTLGHEVRLLTGSTKKKARVEILEGLLSGQVRVLIGTHALLEPDVRFAALGLAVIDEQHRFGVEQRTVLRGKRGAGVPDLLLMTATPIPRTLALTWYGDLDISSLRGLPPGRKGVDTRLVRADQSDEVYLQLRWVLDEGGRGFVVLPAIEVDDDDSPLLAATDMAERMQEEMAPHKVALLHGKMGAEEKQSIMAAFRSGETSLLVSTTVIEVGVDVPEARMMVVENAERFGLSQLHQLRGRVGRGQELGICALILRIPSNDAETRLEVLTSTQDGFEVAERDLELRGPGEMLGTRQAGGFELPMVEFPRDRILLDQARSAVQDLLVEDPTLKAPKHQRLSAEAHRRYQRLLEVADGG
jgi:ATP-dependent DNA helicase RecG